MSTTSNLVNVTPTVTARTADLAEVAVHLHPDDEVAVARVPLPPGLRLHTPYGEVRVSRLVPSGHKVALRAVAEGDAVHKYGQVIGFATFFFSSRRRHTRSDRDWSSDVCSSD